jgi:hypothetical protein
MWFVCRLPLCNADRRQAWWIESIAVGDEFFIVTIKQHGGLRANVRKVKGVEEGYQPREGAGMHIADSTIKIYTIDWHYTFFGRR